MALWRSGRAVAAWCAVTTAGAVLTWVGLHPVLDTAVPDRLTSLTAADLRHQATPSPLPVPTPVLPSSAPPAIGSAAAGSTTTRTAPGAHPSPSTLDGWTVTTAADGSVSYLRSFTVPGGSAVIRMVPGRVSLVSATPAAQYSVTTTQNDPNRLVVQFLAPQREDIIDAIWWNDKPFAQVSGVS